MTGRDVFEAVQGEIARPEEWISFLELDDSQRELWERVADKLHGVIK